ncbi:hypothetical protein JXA70_01060 [candidate division KSB1 bacterium]|nr:hypothetical protein [candidate division KSB1 bacterium]
MLSSKNTAILSFITIFIAGIAVGVMWDNFVLNKKRPENRRRDHNAQILKKFTQELSLTETQQDTLKMLLDEIKMKHQKLDEKRHEEFEKIRSEFDGKFTKILTSEQKVRYEQMVQEFKKRWEDRKKKETRKGED